MGRFFFVPSADFFEMSARDWRFCDRIMNEN